MVAECAEKVHTLGCVFQGKRDDEISPKGICWHFREMLTAHLKELNYLEV